MYGVIKRGEEDTEKSHSAAMRDTKTAVYASVLDVDLVSTERRTRWSLCLSVVLITHK